MFDRGGGERQHGPRVGIPLSVAEDVTSSTWTSWQTWWVSRGRVKGEGDVWPQGKEEGEGESSCE